MVVVMTCFLTPFPFPHHVSNNIYKCKQLRQYHSNNHDHNGNNEGHLSDKLPCGLPITELLVCAGFFLIYLAEELVHACLSHSQPEFFGPEKKANHTGKGKSLQEERRVSLASSFAKKNHSKLQEASDGVTEAAVFVVCSDKDQLIQSCSGEKRKGKSGIRNKICFKNCSPPESPPSCCKLASYGSIHSLTDGKEVDQMTKTDQHESNSLLLHPDRRSKRVNSCPDGTGSVICCLDRDCNIDVDDGNTFAAGTASSNEVDSDLSVFRCIMIVFALSFHSIFDGLAIGLQDTTAHMIQLMVAVSMHKLLIAFVVGLEIFSATKSVSRVFLYMLPFSSMSPVGLIVAAVTKLNLSNSLVGILTGLSTGSLLYITFFEILFREKSNSKLSGLIQFMAVFTGFCLMAALQTFTEHEH